MNRAWSFDLSKLPQKRTYKRLASSIRPIFNLATIPTKVGLIGLGTIFSSVLALAYVLNLSFQKKTPGLSEIIPVFKKNSYADFWEAIIMGIFMAAALAMSYLLKFENPYWIPVSCAAVMQGASLYHIAQRSLHRIMGTFVGLGFCWGLLNISDNVVMLCFFIIMLQLIVEILVVRNYAFAVIFITPLAIFLSEAANPLIHSPNDLIKLRLMETLIGSLLGALGGWILYKEKIRYASILGLKKISNEFKVG